MIRAWMHGEAGWMALVLRSCVVVLVVAVATGCRLAGQGSETETETQVETEPSNEFVTWSKTEVQLQFGRLKTPEFAGGGEQDTTIITLQHFSDLSYGSNFFFVDFIDGGDGSFNNKDIYAEWYPTLSVGKLSGRDLSFGLVRDVEVIAGVNMAADANVVRFLPGIRLSLDLPGFAFANLDLMAYLDASGGLSSGGSPAQGDSYLVDFNWGLPFTLGNQSFSLEGHIEVGGGTTNELGNRVETHILAQPQLRWDLGKAIGKAENHLFVGIEYQGWVNKLGEDGTHESAVQALVVWRF